ncbi:MAG: peptidylprolyl isomerase, partial [Candidatus Riflebacteria bacterium]|nr:peptidylprolyl isomerase [Candidatus Riflebacteria bacterium]
MSKASFMSMRWLRLHIKEIIWATVLLFVGSIFVIGYGTSRAIKQQEDRKQKLDESERRAEELRNMLPSHLQSKLNMPVAHVSLPTENASLTTMIDVKTVWRAIKDSPEYQQLQSDSMPAGIREFYGKMLKEKALESLISMSLLELYARAHNIKPEITVAAIIEKDRQSISPVEFNRQLQREGLTLDEYGQQRLKQATYQAVSQKIMATVAPASATEDFLKNYYETNKIRFKEDDQISFNHLLISPSDFTGMAEVNETQIRDYFDKHREEFKSSERLSLSHILINPNEPAFKANIVVSDDEIRRRYTDNLDRFKDPEKVKARHILIKPKNSFDEKFGELSINLRNFTSAEVDGKTLFTFDAGISNLQSSTSLTREDFVLITNDGAKLTADDASLEKTENPLELPIAGATKAAMFGKIGIFAKTGALPLSLVITHAGETRTVDVAAAFDPEKAFESARSEIEAIHQQLKDGKDFAELAKKLSQDTGSAVKGGDLGEFARGAMVKPFEDAAFTASIGKVVGPIKSQFGYHLIKVDGKSAEKVRSFEEAKAELAAEIRDAQATLKAESTLETVRQKVEQQSETFESLAKLHSMAGSRSEGGKLPIIFAGDISDDYSPDQKKIISAELGNNGTSIAKEIEDAVFSLELGELSRVIKTDNGYHLFRLEAKNPPINLDLTASLKIKIHEILEKEAREKMAQAKAEKLRTSNPTATVPELAKLSEDGTDKDKETKTAFGPLAISANPGYSSYAISDGTGLFSADGRTYLPEMHTALMKLVKDGKWTGKVAGPIKSELGYHFLEVTSYETNRNEPYEEAKEKIRRMVTLEPSAEEIQKEFEANIDKFDIPATRRIRQIVISEEKSATELYNRLKQGEIFALLANRYSIDGSSGNGGLIAGFQMAETGETVTLASAFQLGLRYFWKLLVIQLILGLAALAVFAPLIFGGALLTILSLGIALICLIP